MALNLGSVNWESFWSGFGCCELWGFQVRLLCSTSRLNSWDGNCFFPEVLVMSTFSMVRASEGSRISLFMMRVLIIDSLITKYLDDWSFLFTQFMRILRAHGFCFTSFLSGNSSFHSLYSFSFCARRSKLFVWLTVYPMLWFVFY